MLADYHVHTEFSDDSTEPMGNVINKAIALNIDEICFTDHVDYGIKADHDEKRKAAGVLGLQGQTAAGALLLDLFGN